MDTVAGYPVRQPYPGEDDFFRKNPTVAGMAGEDDAITLNPYSNLTKEQQSAVALNEAVRLYLRKSKLDPDFKIEPTQTKLFADYEKSGIPGEREAKDVRATIIGRLISGDESAGPYTAEQRKAAEIVARRMGLRK